LYAAGTFSGFSAAGAAVGGSSLALGPAITLGMNPFGGSPSAKFSAPVPSGVVNSSPVKPGGADAVGQSAAPGPMQEASPLMYPRNEFPNSCELMGACLAQDAGSPMTGTEGSSSGDSNTRDQGDLGADVVMTVLPLPTPTKIRLGVGASKILMRALILAKYVRLPGWAAHHVVAFGARAAAPARAVLRRFNIPINSAANGVFLPGSSKVANPIGAAVHSKLHTKAYFQAVNDALAQATSQGHALDILTDIRKALLSGGFP
jgi:hypothetical protein